MESRRRFLQTSVAAAMASGSVLGANDRVNVGLVGFGMRGTQLQNSFARHSDCVIAAACEVDQSRLDKAAAAIGGKVDKYTDYRRLFERKDIDAVILAVPDHWHSPMMIAACEAGKDVYVEKPISNTIEPGLKMVDAAAKYKRVVQMGCQQRSWHHFQECATKIHNGYLGRINHCILLFGSSSGGGFRMPAMKNEIPEGFDWEAWQGPAERHPYEAMRQRGWRSYYDYGGGTITDWGVHLSDVMTWYMKSDREGPLLTSASSQYVDSKPNLETAPDTYSITWKYENFVGTFTNTTMPSQDPDLGMSDAYGDYFYGQNGVMQVNRYGYAVTPSPPRRMRQRGGAPAANTPPPKPAIDAVRDMDPNGMSEDPDSTFGSATVRHARNFLDCMKSRQQPVCDIETGFYSSLPCLLAVMSIRQGRSFAWDASARAAKPA